jgi:hypothetical protein
MWLWLLMACSNAPERPPPPASPTSTVKPPIELPEPKTKTKGRFIKNAVEVDRGITQTEAILTKVVEAHTRDPTNPWAIGHGLVAEGQNMMLSNGVMAVDWLFSTYAKRQKVDSRWLLSFPESQGRIRIEPHPDLLLKAITDAGIQPDYPVKVMGHAHTVSDLYKGVLYETYFDATSGRSSYTDANEMPWSLFGIASWASPKMSWTGSFGHDTSLDDFTDHVGHQLNRATQFIADAKRDGRQFKKQRQGIFAFTCGGSHLIQGVVHARLLGFGQSTKNSPFSEEVDRLAYRYPIELAQIDAGIQSHPSFRLPLLIQRLKLTGHTLETLARIATSGVANSPDHLTLSKYIADLSESVLALQANGAFENINLIGQKNEQMYLDLVGDSAHALRGLRIATGQSAVYY